MTDLKTDAIHAARRRLINWIFLRKKAPSINWRGKRERETWILKLIDSSKAAACEIDRGGINDERSEKRRTRGRQCWDRRAFGAGGGGGEIGLEAWRESRGLPKLIHKGREENNRWRPIYAIKPKIISQVFYTTAFCILIVGGWK